ncbi:MAG: DPP IV N-terminal domain-containing protein, partial [Chloroflexota bacterium]
MTKITKAYGLWPSPISPRSLADSLTLTDVQWDTTSDTLVWHERRGAKGVLVAQAGEQAPRDLTDDQSVRARVGYGGGDFTVAQGNVYFAGNGGRLYKQSLKSGSAKPITPAFGDVAAPTVSADEKWVLYVHSDEGVDSLALVDTDGKKWPSKFAEGTDFLMQPTWHPDGEYVAYVAWNHPQMPWDGAELRLVTVEYDRDGIPFPAQTLTIAGDTETSVFQPEFSPDGRYLAYVSDATGWNQLYIYEIASQTHTQITTEEVDHGAPAWVQGMRVFSWTPDSHHLIFTYNLEGSRYLTYCDIHKSIQTGLWEGLTVYTDMTHISVSPVDGRVAVIASSAKIPSRVVSY